MKKLIQTLSLVLIIIFTSQAQIGQFETATDIGEPVMKGSSTYDEATQSYTLNGGGDNIWYNHDKFHFLFKKIKGDFILTANFALIGNEDGNGHRKTGWMIRESTDADAVSMNSCIHGDGLVVLQWRLMRGAYMRDPQEEIFFPKWYFGEVVIQLERIGKTITMRIANPGEPLEDMGSVDLPELNDEVLVGPYSLAHDPEEKDIQEVRVWNVSIVKPVAPDWHPNPLVETISYDGLELPSKLEIIDVVSRKRKVIYESDGVLGTPSFSSKGNSVLFTDGDKTVQVATEGGNATAATANVLKAKAGKHTYYSDGKTNTNQIWRKNKKGTGATQMTYDLGHARFPHVSPNGKQVAYLSFPNDSKPKEAVAYQPVTLKVMPTDGGAAKIIAYFYGGKGSFENYAWSPDSKSLVFVSTGE